MAKDRETPVHRSRGPAEMGEEAIMKRLAALLFAAVLLWSAPALALTEEEMTDAALAAGRAAVADCVDGSMTDVEKLTALHDWLALHCEYGHAPNSETAYGALAEGSAACRGYSEGYACLAGLAGLEGTSTYSEYLDHAWILVTLDGTRYFSDCTWDDGKYARLGLVRHKYWLFNEANAMDTGHLGWDSGESVPGGELENAPWRYAVTRVNFLGDWAYYIDGEFRLIRCGRADWETETLLELSLRWPDTDPEDGKDPEIYSGLNLLGDRLYFNTPAEVLSVDLLGGDLRTEFAPDTSERLIYGTAVREGRLCCSLAERPDAVLFDVLDTGVSAAEALYG